MWVAGGVLFILLATANGAGYRYGVSDQAFYIPVVTRSLEPAAFPRDASLIDAEATDGARRAPRRVHSRHRSVARDALPRGYIVSMALLWTGLVLIGKRGAFKPVGHGGTRGRVLDAAPDSTNEREFARTVLSPPDARVRDWHTGGGSVMRRRAWIAIALVALCAVMHITTACGSRHDRGRAVGAGRAASKIGHRGGWRGDRHPVLGSHARPLRDAAVTMDETWLQAVASKDSLFATQWPIWAWVANLGFLALLHWAHRVRERRGRRTTGRCRARLGCDDARGVVSATLPWVAAAGHWPSSFRSPESSGSWTSSHRIRDFSRSKAGLHLPPTDHRRVPFSSRSPRREAHT
jgi:hypothetical protein